MNLKITRNSSGEIKIQSEYVSLLISLSEDLLILHVFLDSWFYTMYGYLIYL